MSYAKWLMANGYPETAQQALWPVIRNDLYYTAQYWYIPHTFKPNTCMTSINFQE